MLESTREDDRGSNHRMLEQLLGRRTCKRRLEAPWESIDWLKEGRIERRTSEGGRKIIIFGTKQANVFWDFRWEAC